MVSTDNIQQLISELEAELAQRGLSLGSLKACADEVIVFGSRAIGQAESGSDWDVLLINCSQKPNAMDFDFVVVHTDTASWANWLQSELGHHVAKYGFWIKGKGEWKSKITKPLLAVERKRTRIKTRLTSILKLWPILGPRFRRKWVTLARRDIQRLLLLQDCTAVPPTPLLDEDFRRHADWFPSAIVELRKRGDDELAELVERFSELAK